MRATIKELFLLTASLAALVGHADSGDSSPFLLDTAEGTRIATEGAAIPIAYSPRWSNAASCEVAVDGNRLVSAAKEGETIWTPQGTGGHTLTHTAGDLTYTARFTVLGDDVVVHSGTITANELWESNKVHLVAASVIVGDDYDFSYFCELEIQAGAIVKFMPGSGISIKSNAYCRASGAIFTHVNDDTIGGDTLMDGDETVPVMNEYDVPNMLVWDDEIEFRYFSDPKVTLSGTISADEIWRGHNIYCVTGNLTVASGKTLTIMPGAIVKFAAGLSLTVNGTLNAQGTRAQPIVFTSLKDDAHGGDTNGDGDKTYPYAGDWYQIRVAGTANFNYCHVLYNSSTENYGAVEAYGGTVTFDNSEIAHTKYECVNAHSSGNFTACNSIFRDSSLGFGYYGSGRVKAYNCVFSDMSVAVRQSGKTLTNCVFYRCLAFTDQSGDGSTYKNCVFYNPAGYGAQSYSKCGSNGNIWGDPMFVDAENGDFRIQKGSPCINAGDAANAPEFDYYSQPRDDRPDVGIYEAVGNLMSANDLAAVAVNAQAARSTIGDTLTVSYDVANVGKQAINGSWRDKVSLVSADGGYSIDLGMVVQSAALAVGATNTFNASFTVPTDAEGTWRVQVGVNVERDIYEGANVTNNVATSAETVEISLPARAAADGFSGTATKGAPACAKFALDGAEPMVAQINAPAGTIVYLGSGFMPSASTYSARAVVGADGGLIGIPAGVTTAYLLVETTSSKGAAFMMTLESAALAVQSVTPATLPYTGTTGLVIDGANFAEGCTVVVERAASAFGTGEPPVLLSTVVSPTRMTAQIDCSRLTAGAIYDVKVVGADGGTATLPSAVTVANVPAAPKLKATLDAPASVRRGRTLTVYIDYENVGNADLPAPIFELISQGQVFKIDGACYTNSVKVMGLSSEAPVGTLRPGEPQRLGIPVTILAENVKWKLKSYHAAQASAKSAKFSLRELYDEDWVLYHVSDDDTTIANLHTAIGSTFADYYTSLGAWLGTVEPQTKDYEVLKSAFGRYQYLKAAGMLESDVAATPSSSQSSGGRLSSAATPASVGRGALTAPKGGHGHTRMSSNWKNAGNGSIFKLCPTCKEWYQLVTYVGSSADENWKNWYELMEESAFNSAKDTYIICHGNRNSVNEPWIKSMGLAIMGRYEDSSDVMVLAVNWGEGAYRYGSYTAHPAAGAIPEVADEAARQLAKLGVVPGNTMLIGHSHGAHVAANIACHYSEYGNGARFKRFVGLDTSTTDNFIHGLWVKSNDIIPDLKRWYGSWTPEKWISEIRNKCKQTEFYKTSWDMSLEKSSELYGDYNFFVSRPFDFNEHEIVGFILELGRHSYAHEWFETTISGASEYSNIGFNFDKEADSWSKRAGSSGDARTPKPKEFAGVIRGSTIELLDQGKGLPGWRYGYRIQAQNLSEETTATRRLWERTAFSVDYKLNSASIPDEIVSGKTLLKATARNGADNLSINFKELVADDVLKSYDWMMGQLGGRSHIAWLVDLEGLKQVSAEANYTDWDNATVTDLARALDGGSVDYFARELGQFNIGNDACRTVIMPGATTDLELTPSFGINIFGEDRPLASIDEEGNPVRREVLLVLSTGYVKLPQSKDLAGEKQTGIDIYPEDNFVIKRVTLNSSEIKAIISLAAGRKNAASLKSARLLAAPTHELSENALKPGEVVQVKADKNGNWSIALDCTGSYTTADEDEIVFNRFELTDAGNEDGAPRFQNNNTICDVERVTVSGTLPQTTDADGNLVCEGKRYTVQLTVASGDNEDDVTTCVIDVRAVEDEDPGEDEDAGGSNEPKSCDPNEMVGEDGVGEARYVKPGQELTYTIYFENKSDADAAAACVEVFNPLNEWLDWSSLTMLDVGYNNNVDNGLGGLHEGVSEKAMDGTNVSVRTEFAVVYYDEEGNVVDADARDARPYRAVAQWYLRIIDPNGDSDGWPLDMTGGFLPPNDDTHCGEGYIRYKVKVRDDAPGNVVITNSATIIFDHWDEDALETDPAWWNTVRSLGAQFSAPEVVADEGGAAEIRVSGGSADAAASVKVYLTYNTVAAADIDLKTAAVSSTGSLPVQEGNAQAARSTGLKFPLTLSWAKGEVGEKVITIPVKTDKTVEDDEFFTLQLAEAVGMELGEERVCTVTIRDMNDKTLKTTVTPYKPKAGETVATNSMSVVSGDAKGGFVAGTGEYTSGSKLTLTAEARPGWAFVGWATRSAQDILSNKTKWQIVVTNDEEYVAVFEKIPYVRGLADPADGGKVSGSGLCAAGKKVTLKATTNKNYAFLGWVAGASETRPYQEGEFVATTASLVIDRTAKPAANSKTSTTITNIAEDVTYYAVFKSDPEIFVTVDATDGTGAEPTGKGAGKYVAGTITGMGKYAIGKTKIALKAAANKGYVFNGWYDADGELLTKDATYTVAAMGEDDVEYTAKFITAAEDKASIALALTMAAEAEALGLSTNEIASITNFCGVVMNWQLAANALSATTIKVAGLPSGLKFTAKDIMKKGSKTEVGIPANTIYGAPTAASKTDRSGNVTPSKVVFTVTTAGKSTQAFAVNLYVDPLPAWSVGMFDGEVGNGESGTVTLTVAASGKISGKTLEGGKTWTLSATSFDEVRRIEGNAPYEDDLAFLATVIGKAGKEVVTNEVTVSAMEMRRVEDNAPYQVGVVSGEAPVGRDDPIAPLSWTAYQNLWKRADTKADMPVFKANIVVDYLLGEPGDANNTVKVTFKKDGVVSFAGKVKGVAVSGTSQLVLVRRDGAVAPYQVTLYVPPKAAVRPPFDGWCETFPVAITMDDANVVTDVDVSSSEP